MKLGMWQTYFNLGKYDVVNAYNSKVVDFAIEHWKYCNLKIHGCKIQDISTSISIKFNIDQVAPDNDANESDNHLDAQNCRNSCLKFLAYLSQN